MGIKRMAVSKIDFSGVPITPTPDVNNTGTKGTAVTGLSLDGLSWVCLYFSAHWCPPCKQFTPKLAEVYKKGHEGVEVVFLSSDQGPEQMTGYFNEMPWAAIPHGHSKKTDLSNMFKVRGIPTLVICKVVNGEIVYHNKNGRAVAMSAVGQEKNLAEVCNDSSINPYTAL